MKKEEAYSFRKKIMTVHEPGRRNPARKPGEREFFCRDGVRIAAQDGEVVSTAAKDLQEYLWISMGVRAELTDPVRDAGEPVEDGRRTEGDAGVITLRNLSEKADPASGKKDGFTITAGENGIDIVGDTARGTAQGIYYLEDLMSFEEAPVCAFGKIQREPVFSPRMVHSGYGLDEYPNEYLSAIAHDGRDAILVFTKDVNRTPSGYLDFNDLIRRAARYGIDVYAYSYLISDMSPEAEGAEAYYENTYGRLFRECPGLRGVTLVGESVEFPSRDPHVSKGRYYENTVDGIPTGKVSSGWYPCEDYPVWLDLIKRVIRKYNPEADIVFWTYNWGFQPEEARVKLIESLPTDISLQATYEMFEPRRYGSSVGVCADYTLSFEGPGAYFASEAKAARMRGIRLYSMTNTGGLTWDFGTVPYEPMPYQWMRRYAGMKQAAKDWGLCGIMESHHFGFYPSFISRLSKWVFLQPREEKPCSASAVSIDDADVCPEDRSILRRILGVWFGRENAETADRAMRYFSDAIRCYVPSNADQYGAFRVGPAYPFCLETAVSIPADKSAMFGSGICMPIYSGMADEGSTLPGIRIFDEIGSLEQMKDLMEKGIGELETAEAPNDRLEELLNLGRYIRNTVETGIHAKQWYVMKTHLAAAVDREEIGRILTDMETLLQKEIENAQRTIPFVEQDSRLGWEPSMLYIGDRWHLEWKIRQVRYVLETEIRKYRNCLNL